MSLGFVMLVHEALDRATQVARHLAEQGCPVVMHVDARVPARAHDGLVRDLGDLENLRFAQRHCCEWGTWSLVAATQEATALMLAEFPGVRHVYLMSGLCLPLRPIAELRAYLDARPRTDFIESATTRDVPWAAGGLDTERFSLRFPFSWKRQRRLFDGYVALQRRLGMRRRLPEGLVPHLGSQWWCLTRDSLRTILEDPMRGVHERFFRRVWIPDESYFQTLIRHHSAHVDSRSLTLSKFNFQGKPHLFYDDHIQLLRESNCFFARKAWPGASRLYESFLSPRFEMRRTTDPTPARVDKVFSDAIARRTKGRPGLYMMGRYPWRDRAAPPTAAPYTMACGFDPVISGFGDWLGKATVACCHGHLFAQGRAEFAGGATVFAGCLPDIATLRNYNPRAFLTNLIWNTMGEHQAFLFGPSDHQDIRWTLAEDGNARIRIVTGAWALELFRSGLDFETARNEAARLQKIEVEFLSTLRRNGAVADLKVWTLAAFIAQPMEALQSLIDSAGRRGGPTEVPKMPDLEEFPEFLQRLRNHGMHPHMAGEFPAAAKQDSGRRRRRQPYTVQ